MENSQPPANFIQWLSLLFATIALAFGVAGAWIKDRLTISTRLNEFDKKITRLDSKIDALMNVYRLKEKHDEQDEQDD